MGKNKNLEKTQGSEKKHNKLASWFLGLPKWGKILLIGGSVVGVSSAVVFPVLGATVWSKESYKVITNDEAYDYCVNNFCYTASQAKDVASKVKGGSFKWDMSEDNKKLVFNGFADLLPYTSLKGKAVADIPNIGNLTVTDIDGYRTALPDSDLGDVFYTAKEKIGTRESFTKMISECRLYGEDLYMIIEPDSSSTVSGSYAARYSKEGILKEFILNLVDSSGGNLKGTLVHNL